MPAKTRVFKIAQLLLDQSLDSSGKVDQQKVVQTLSSLREEPPLQHLEVLKAFLQLVNRRIASYKGVLEFNGGDGQKLAKNLCTVESDHHSNSELDTSENKSLIAGLRLRIGDDVYEDSIANRINNLRKALI
jgi:F-type H+-transporting ATPase subunit delta